MQQIIVDIRGEPGNERLLKQTKFFTILTLSQVFIGVLDTIVGNESEKLGAQLQTIMKIVLEQLNKHYAKFVKPQGINDI